MHIVCRLKKEAEKIKIARNVFSGIHNTKDFVVKFELKGGFVEEKVYKKHNKILERALKIFYKNHFKVLLSDIAPLNFNVKMKIDFTLKENIVYYYLEKFSVQNIDCYTDFPRLGRPKYGNVSEDLRFPNLRLVFEEPKLSLDFFIKILQEIKKDFSKKALDDIYKNVLDEFIRIAKEKIKDEEISAQSFHIKLSNHFIAIYYNLDFVFSPFSNKVKLLFRNVGWNWNKIDQNKELDIYILRYPLKNEDILKDVLLYIVRHYPNISAEEVDKIMGYIFYELCENLLSYLVKGKFINKILLDRILKAIEEQFNKLEYNPFGASLSHFLLLPKDESVMPLSPKSKLVLHILKDIIEKIAKNGEKVQEKLKKAFIECISQNEMCLLISIKYPSENWENFSIYVEIYYKNRPDGIELMHINISRKNYLERYYGIDIRTRHALYYNYFEEDIKKILEYSAHSLFAFLEIAGINKHQIKFILRKIETDFLYFE